MANKTQATELDVNSFLTTVENERRRLDASYMVDMMRRVTGKEPKMWGSSLIGFDAYRYKLANGREEEFFMTGCSPRKTSLSVYVMPGFDAYSELMTRLGKHKTGASCLYINKLDDVDLDVLEELVSKSYKAMVEMYGSAQEG